MTGAAIRAGRASDLPELTDLINHYILHTAATFDIEPFTVDARRAWMAQFDNGQGRYRLFVAERNGRLAGYADSHRFRARAAYDTTVESSVYLAPDAHGQGVGTALYSHLFEALREEDIRCVLAGITQPNPASVALHKRFGFESCGVMREVGRKHGRYCDVEWFQRLQ